MSQAKIGVGTKLELGDGASPENFTPIAEVVSLDFNGRKIDHPKVTNMDSPEVNGLVYDEFITGIADGGSCDFTANYLPADSSQAAFTSAFDGSLHSWRVQHPNAGGRWAFSGFVEEAPISYPYEKQMQLKGKIKITGPAIFTPSV